MNSLESYLPVPNLPINKTKVEQHVLFTFELDAEQVPTNFRLLFATNEKRPEGSANWPVLFSGGSPNLVIMNSAQGLLSSNSKLLFMNGELWVDNSPFRGVGYFFSSPTAKSRRQQSTSTPNASKSPFDYKKGVNGSLANFADIAELPSEKFEALYELFVLYFNTPK